MLTSNLISHHLNCYSRTWSYSAVFYSLLAWADYCVDVVDCFHSYFSDWPGAP
jgi:hypothetical protein